MKLIIKQFKIIKKNIKRLFLCIERMKKSSIYNILLFFLKWKNTNGESELFEIGIN